MTSSRVVRARQTEAIVADFLRQNGFPYAERIPAGLPGSDITGCPGLNWEVKARRGLDLPGWLRQVSKREGVPLLVSRPDGWGEAKVSLWPMTMPLGAGVELLRQAGYGTPMEGCGEC